MTPEARARQTIDALLAAGRLARLRHGRRQHPRRPWRGDPRISPEPRPRLCRLPALHRRQSRRRDRGQEGGRHPHRRRSAIRPLRPGPAGRAARLGAALALQLRIHRHRNPLHPGPGPAAARPRRVRLSPARDAGRLPERPAGHGLAILRCRPHGHRNATDRQRRRLCSPHLPRPPANPAAAHRSRPVARADRRHPQSGELASRPTSPAP